MRRATTCYMAKRGVAYQLWLAIEDERLNRGWTKLRMAELIGLPRTTIDRLASSPNQPRAVTVHVIADALGIPRRKAETLAGLREPSPGDPGEVSVRDAIMRDPIYTDRQRQAMLDLVDIFEQANAEQGRRVS